MVTYSTKPIYVGGSETEQGNKLDNSGAGASIINMLEVIESDFTKSLAEAQTDEDAAQAEYDKTSMQNKLDKKQKQQDVKHKGKQIVKLEHELSQMKSDLNSKQKELLAVLEYWKTISAQCIVQPESFEERMRRRQAEIDGLKEALRILTTETAMMQVPKRVLRGAHRHH
jgi:predicted  nucleic acid-binding Zn-ribbon protein